MTTIQEAEITVDATIRNKLQSNQTYMLQPFCDGWLIHIYEIYVIPSKWFRDATTETKHITTVGGFNLEDAINKIK